MGLTKEQILAASDVTIKTVDVPEWGGSVAVRSVSAKGRAVFENIFTEWGKGNIELAYPKILALTLCDEQGNLLFSESEAEALGNKNGTVAGRLVKAAFEINGIGGAATEQAKGNS